MIAAVDETTLEHRSGLIYVLATVVVIADGDQARDILRAVVGCRERPFHWVKEGPQARQRMVETVASLGAVGYCYQAPCGRKGQDKARAELLPLAFGWAIREGAASILIESRGHKLDIQDKRVTKQLRAGGVEVPEVSWDRKSNPLLWLPDAVCGAHRELHIAAVEGRSAPSVASDLIAAADLGIEYIGHK